MDNTLFLIPWAKHFMSNNFKHARARYCLALLVIDSCLVDLVLQKKSAQSKVVDVVDDVDSDVDVVESDVGKSGGETSLIADTA